MGKSKAHDGPDHADDAKSLNTLGKSVCGGVNTIPAVGPMLAPVAEKYLPSIGVFRSKPKKPNEAMLTMEQRSQEIEAAAKQGAREFEDFQFRVIREAHKETAEALVEAKQAKEEVQRLQWRVRNAQSRQHAAETASAAKRAQLKAAAKDARKQVDAARRREDEAIAKLGRCCGLQLNQVPSTEQMQAVKNRIQYSDGNYHFGFCGFTGTGKSSLINSFRGLRPKDPGAAPVGTNETTSNITRYPDPSSELPYSRLVCYDIPGGGTSSASSEGYYMQQGLYAFDAVIVVFADRFTELDERIIKDCVHNNTPVFIVRSKADHHIHDKIWEDTNLTHSDDEYEMVYPEVKDEYVKETEWYVDKCLRRMANDLDVNERDRFLLEERRLHRVYIVSAPNLLRFMNRVRDSAGGRRRMDRSKMNDEAMLIDHMLRVAGERRGVRMG